MLGASALLCATNDNKNAVNTKNLSTADSTKTTQNKGENMNPQVWYITAASGGLGFALAKYLLSKGDKVAGTSRTLSKLTEKLGNESENFLPLELKFDDNLSKNIDENLAQIKAKFGRLDNVVNNAGYGLLSFVEELDERDLREQFEVNVFAPFLITKKALGIMRPQAISEKGSKENVRARIFNISSIGGFKVSTSATPYCMSKFAISALSEGTLLDTQDFGIAAINVMPGGFRTQFFGTSKKYSTDTISDYDKARNDFKAFVEKYSGTQAGNPDKFAEVLHKVSRMQKPPLSLFVSEGAFSLAESKIKWVQDDMKNTRDFAGKAADFS